MGRSLDEVIAALPKSRRARIDRRYRELCDDVERLQSLCRANLTAPITRPRRSKWTARS